MCVNSSGLCSLGRRGFNQPLWWWACEVRALIWPLFTWSALARTANVVAGTTGEGSALASIRSYGMGTASHCCGGNDSLEHWSALYLMGWCVLWHPLWWRARLLRALLWPMCARSALAQKATVVAGQASHFGSVKDR